MLVVAPFGETADVVEGALVVGVEDMGAVAMHQDTGLVELVVHVAADVVALLDDEHLFAATLGQLARRDRARETGADDDRVEFGDVDVFESGILNAHGAPFG